MPIMKIILLSAFAATSLMTIFSYAVSASFRKLYKEPLLLQYILSRLNIELNEIPKRIAAWSLHYAIGVVFALGFHLAVLSGITKNIWLLGACYGILIGIMGIIGWNIMFAIAGQPQKTDSLGYYTQLFTAHLLFALTVTVIYEYLFTCLSE
jgi:hypothetical protein